LEEEADHRSAFHAHHFLASREAFFGKSFAQNCFGGTEMSLNKILLIGNLGSDPEMRSLPSGKKVAQFAVATNRRYKLEGQVRVETEWFQIAAFGRLAEICGEFLKKGKPVFIEGRIHTRSWIDQAGQKHYRTQVVAEGMRMIGKANGSDERQPTQSEDPEPF
jgi:single-strand DNA-binding protein